MGVYVHIPFCEQKCYYCDFHSVVVGSQESFTLVTNNYLVSLRQEALYYRSLWGDQPLSTLFLGGGTPSLLPAKELGDLVTFLRQELPFVPEPEITMEANPNSLTPEGAAILVEAGVNRVSLGVQAFQDPLLKAIGRIHQASQIEESVRGLRQAGISDINLDLMFGLPGQSIENWRETLAGAIALAPTHLSCYGLILEPGTPFATWEAAGLLDVPSDDSQAEMYDIARKVLRAAGYDHYEISNFCLPGWQSEHNLIYWHNRAFLGLGSGATGYVHGLRYTNVADIQEYVNSWAKGTPPYQESTEVTKDQEMDETMMVGMRLLQGVAEADFEGRYKVSFWQIYGPQITKLQQNGLAEYADGYLRVTERGLFLENMVSGAFLR